MNKLAIIPYVSLAICLQQGAAFAIGFGYSPDGENPPTAVHIKEAKPLSAEATYINKFDRFTDAIDDNDFHRVIVLFTDCANAGDAMCQFFLADGVSEWLLRDTVPHEEEYGPAFVRKWLRRAFDRPPLGCVKGADSCIDPYDFVTSNWFVYYHSGIMGFPKDESLYRCWREVSNANNDMSREAILGRAETCRNLEISKYGKDAEWLSR
jgi:hypothetical protein